MIIPSGRVDFAFGVDPLTRPADTDWVTFGRFLTAHVKYGVRGRTGEPEPSSMTVVVDDPNRDLDPANTSGTYYPNVKYRTRVRVVATPAGDDERVVLTGFVASIKRSTRVQVNEVTIELDDLLAVQAGQTIGATAFDIGLVDILQDARWVSDVMIGVGELRAGYWPLAESSGRAAAEKIYGRNGAYLRQVTPENADIPWDSRPLQKFGWSGSGDIQRAELTNPSFEQLVDEDTFTLCMEVALPNVSLTWPDTGGEARLVLWALGRISVDNLFTTELNIPPSARLLAAWDSDGNRTLQLLVTWNSGLRGVSVTAPLDVFDDGKPHQVFARLSPFASRSSSAIHIDGEDRTLAVTTVLDQAIPAYTFQYLPHFVSGGAWAYDSTSGEVTRPSDELSFTAGRVVYEYNVAVGDEGSAALWELRNRPWDGDRTGARLARLADLAGIDPLDLDLADGIGICGPVAIAGRTLGEIVEETAATEGGFVYCDPDGRIRSRARTPNDPAPLVTYGNVNAPGVVLHEPIDHEFSLARTITVAEVEWAGSSEPEIVKGDTTYGEITTRVHTAARTPGGARAIGQRLVTYNSTPREQIDSLTILGVLPTTTLAATFDIRPGDAVRLVEDDQATLHIVESVEHNWTEGVKLTTTLGLREHLVLPVATFDVSGRGFDESVFGTQYVERHATIPGRHDVSRTSPAARRRRRRRSLTP